MVEVSGNAKLDGVLSSFRGNILLLADDWHDGHLRLISVRKGLQERDDLVFLLRGQTEVTDRLVHVLWNLRRRPTGYLFSRSTLLTMGKFIAGVVEVDNLLQALKVAIVRICFDEVGTRPHLHVPQG